MQSDMSVKIQKLMNSDNPLILVEISRSALQKNIRIFRDLVGDGVELAPMVKANAYGHGLVEAGKIFRQAESEYLAVNSIFEARKLREAGDGGKIYIAGYTAKADLAEALELDCELVTYNFETLEALGKLGKPAKVHLKVETGTHRQGVMRKDLGLLVMKLRAVKNIDLVGVTMHFANIEDTTQHDFAKQQLVEFNSIREELNELGLKNIKYHAANSAATLLWDSTHFDIVRIGISAYGMWSSEETFLSLAENRKEKIILTPALTWKTRIVQIKKIPAGAKVGYGCTWEAKQDSKIAILPVGYYDGYARSYSEKAEVLIHSRRVPVVGRVCMNMLMVDISNIPKAKLEDEVVLLGKSGDEEITAEEMGEWGETINYEVTTRIRENILRKVVE
jgi:alanine racemase